MDKHNQRFARIYDTEKEAISAVEDLKRQGYKAEEISVISKNQDDVDTITDETGTTAGEGAATGAVAGGTLGGLTGLLAGVGALVIPGIGPILAAGPIAATLTGAAVGAGVGGLSGALIGLGIPEEDAKHYNASVKEGKILVIVDQKEDSDKRNEQSIPPEVDTTPVEGSVIRENDYNNYEDRDPTINEKDRNINTGANISRKW
ncbi:general stress protein [uncultured Metabacillus sp.]|uniref:general stress protein n=1 Tax=uncultured Metabacillus sp. TaxID=2860135 RepID=UPI002634B2EC|nr:general stress protein [uncultured Metabacillus sp.]